MKKFAALQPEQIKQLLSLLFGHALLFRFLFPFLYSPMEQLWSDPARHWHNGLRFFSNPQFMNGVDAKFYQLFMWAMAQTLVLHPQIILVISGLLCAASAYVWYKAAREVLTKTPALIVAIIIALHPSLLNIYSYFMNETVAILLMGLGVWLTLRTRRKGTPQAFLLACFIWVLAVHTRSSLIPAALLSVCFMLPFVKTEKLKAIFISASVFAMITGASAVYTYNILSRFSPFMVTAPTQAYHYSGARSYQLNILDEAIYGWSSPTLDSRPLLPFSNYGTYRNEANPPQYVFTFRKMDGAAVWDAEIKRLKAAYSWEHRFKDILDNVVFFTVGGSWPDASRGHDDRSIWMINHTLRWTWPLIIIAVLLLFPFLRLREEAAYVVGLLFAITLLMYLQQTGVMEGRYRKPFEPLLILAVPVVWQAIKQPSGLRPWAHVRELLPRALEIRPHNKVADHVFHDTPAPDIRPKALSTETAGPRKKTAAKKPPVLKKKAKPKTARKSTRPKN